MNNELSIFKELCHLFEKNGYSLYLVGGTVRDFLLKLPLEDFDAVTNATPSEMKNFLKNADYTFERYGSVKLHYKGLKFDITTLRKENSYSDSRHPSKIEFCDSLQDDVLRRDFTINGLYMNVDEEILDYVGGQKDLKNHIIKMIGNPDIRLVEDPLRIIRAIRFSINLGFDIDDDLLIAMKKHKDLLNKLNKDKVDQDIRKCKNPTKLLDFLKTL